MSHSRVTDPGERDEVRCRLQVFADAFPALHLHVGSSELAVPYVISPTALIVAVPAGAGEEFTYNGYEMGGDLGPPRTYMHLTALQVMAWLEEQTRVTTGRNDAA